MILLLACIPYPAPGDPDASPFYDGEPAIVDIAWSCEVEAAQWLFSVEADHWTGGGKLWMTEDAAFIEEHAIRSAEAPADGSGDRLELSLDIVADWRDAVAGSSTRYRCADQDALTFQLMVSVPDGSARSDCRTWGAEPMLWSETDAVEACDTVLEDSAAQEDDTG